jgi:hypothetical protein
VGNNLVFLSVSAPSQIQKKMELQEMLDSLPAESAGLLSKTLSELVKELKQAETKDDDDNIMTVEEIVRHPRIQKCYLDQLKVMCGDSYDIDVEEE